MKVSVVSLALGLALGAPALVAAQAPAPQTPVSPAPAAEQPPAAQQPAAQPIPSTTPPSPFPQAVRVGVIDMLRVFGDTAWGKSAQTRIDSLGQRKTAELSERQKKLQSDNQKLETDVRLRGEPRWKHAMHLLRLLQVGTSALLEGRIEVRVPQSARERLLAVRRGELSWEACNAWRLELHAELDRAFSRTALPERPDYAAADALLVRARRSMVR